MLSSLSFTTVSFSLCSPSYRHHAHTFPSKVSLHVNWGGICIYTCAWWGPKMSLGKWFDSLDPKCTFRWYIQHHPVVFWQQKKKLILVPSVKETVGVMCISTHFCNKSNMSLHWIHVLYSCWFLTQPAALQLKRSDLWLLLIFPCLRRVTPWLRSISPHLAWLHIHFGDISPRQRHICI